MFKFFLPWPFIREQGKKKKTTIQNIGEIVSHVNRKDVLVAYLLLLNLSSY